MTRVKSDSSSLCHNQLKSAPSMPPDEQAYGEEGVSVVVAAVAREEAPCLGLNMRGVAGRCCTNRKTRDSSTVHSPAGMCCAALHSEREAESQWDGSTTKAFHSCKRQLTSSTAESLCCLLSLLLFPTGSGLQQHVQDSENTSSCAMLWLVSALVEPVEPVCLDFAPTATTDQLRLQVYLHKKNT